MANDFLTALSDHPLVCDGAMGTMLYAKGFRMTRCFDELNLTHPDQVSELHDAYVDAGADMIETNTYGASRLKLTPHGLGDSVLDINRRGVELARKAADRVARYRKVFVAGSVGPPGRPLQERIYVSMDEIRDSFAEQIEALVSAGVEVLMIETQSNLEEARIAAKEANRIAPDLPLVTLITFDETGETVHGHTPEQAVAALEPLGVDVVGANCSIGPSDLLGVMERMRAVTAGPLAVLPNAGTPRMVEGRYFYVTPPEYMATYAKRFIQVANVSLLGGCCGTTPDHIRAVRAAVRAVPSRREVAAVEVVGPAVPAVDKPSPVPVEDKSPLARLLRNEFAVSVEMRPPRGVDVKRILESAQRLKESGVHCVNLPDGALASARVSPLAVARRIEAEVGIETIVHWCCRDRNLLGMQADLLGAHLLGQRNILAITGDPPRLGDYPSATAVFDIDSIGLIRMMHHLNLGEDVIGRSIGSPTAIHIGLGCDPAAPDQAEEQRRFRLKVESGGEFVMTQPVFDVDQLKRFLDAVQDGLPPVMVGILPLTSYRNAEFYENEIPGMHIPATVLSRMQGAGDGDEAREEGIRIAQELLLAVRGLPRVAGAYLMPPFGRYRLATKVLEAIR